MDFWQPQTQKNTSPLALFMALRLTNALTPSTDPFIPLEPGKPTFIAAGSRSMTFDISVTPQLHQLGCASPISDLERTGREIRSELHRYRRQNIQMGCRGRLPDDGREWIDHVKISLNWFTLNSPIASASSISDMLGLGAWSQQVSRINTLNCPQTIAEVNEAQAPNTSVQNESRLRKWNKVSKSSPSENRERKVFSHRVHIPPRNHAVTLMNSRNL